MKKSILFLIFVLFTIFTSSACLAKATLKKNPDGSYFLFENNLIKEAIPAPPHSIDLDSEKIFKLTTKRGIEKYPIEGTRLTRLLPLPLKEKFITEYSFFFHKEKKWIPGSQKIKGPEEISYTFTFLLLITFIVILAKTMIISPRGELYIKEKIIVDFLFLFMAISTIAGAWGINQIIALVLVASIAEYKAGAMAGATIFIIGIFIFIAGIMVEENSNLALQYLTFLFSSMFISYLLLYLRNKKRKDQGEKNPIQC